MSTVIVIQGLPNGGATPYDGQYLESFDFEAHDGRGDITTTDDLRKAKRFKTAMDAIRFAMTSPQCKPLREDGKENRPLTATNLEFRSIPDVDRP